MLFSEVPTTIETLGHQSTLSFRDKAASLQNALNHLTLQELLEHLDFGGVIPECFDHDSTEEKLFAKYCDGLLARAFNELGLKASVILERAEAADVTAAGDGYAVVGDAKAFRLSRTAKNQKDFKVEALNEWRKGADFATLVAPLYQYPQRTSQIYGQACRYNVTLLSYTHLAFLIRHKPATTPYSLKSLWGVGGSCSTTNDATAYWQAVAQVICTLSKATLQDWNSAVVATYNRLPQQAEEQIRFWEQEKRRIEGLPHDAAVQALIAALKIEAKIEMIRKNLLE